jgi:hypothetical protein
MKELDIIESRCPLVAMDHHAAITGIELAGGFIGPDEPDRLNRHLLYQLNQIHFLRLHALLLLIQPDARIASAYASIVHILAEDKTGGAPACCCARPT